MMKHGAIVLALWCGLSAATFATNTSSERWQDLSPEEMELVWGGDLMLAVDRDKQMMTVTRITPGNYDNIECYSVKVTTAVVRNKDVSPTLAKGAMENTARELPVGKKAVLPKQFPTGTATIASTPTSRDDVEGPVITTDARQPVMETDGRGTSTGLVADSGYNIHYVDPKKATNTLGCVGVQSAAGMERVAQSLKADNASYPAGADPKQTISVNDYTDGPPPASTFAATETKPAAKKPEPKKTEPKKTGHPVARPLRAL